jgi:hypothetical protein
MRYDGEEGIKTRKNKKLMEGVTKDGRMKGNTH